MGSCSGNGTCAAARLHSQGYKCECGSTSFDHTTEEPNRAYCLGCGKDAKDPYDSLSGVAKLACDHGVATYRPGEGWTFTFDEEDLQKLVDEHVREQTLRLSSALDAAIDMETHCCDCPAFGVRDKDATDETPCDCGQREMRDEAREVLRELKGGGDSDS